MMFPKWDIPTKIDGGSRELADARCAFAEAINEGDIVRLRIAARTLQLKIIAEADIHLLTRGGITHTQFPLS